MLWVIAHASSIVGGTTSPEDLATVALVGTAGVYCSGVLIDATHVLTAAHCLPPHADDAIEDIDIFFGGDFTQGGTTIAAVDARVHPAWTPETFANDVGIVALAGPAPVPPAPIGAAAGQAAGDTLRAVGYGIAQTSGNTGIRRSGTVVVDAVDQSTIRLRRGGALTCDGDSGGPLFHGELVVGIHARSNCQTLALAERVDVHAALIAGGAERDADHEIAGGCRVATTDTSWAFASLALVAMRRRRSKRARRCNVMLRRREIGLDHPQQQNHARRARRWPGGHDRPDDRL